MVGEEGGNLCLLMQWQSQVLGTLGGEECGLPGWGCGATDGWVDAGGGADGVVYDASECTWYVVGSGAEMEAWNSWNAGLLGRELRGCR